MNEEDDISTEEILASIRTILLEKQEKEDAEDVLDLTEDMIYRPSVEPDFNGAADQMMDDYAALFEPKTKNFIS